MALPLSSLKVKTEGWDELSINKMRTATRPTPEFRNRSPQDLGNISSYGDDNSVGLLPSNLELTKEIFPFRRLGGLELFDSCDALPG